MDLDYRELDITKFSDFTEQDETLIIEVYDKLSELYDLIVVDIEDSPYKKFSSHEVYPLFVPKICYFVIDKNNTNTFYLFIVSKVGISWRGTHLGRKFDTLQFWGLKELNENLGYISVNKKSLMDKIAGIFNSFNINFKEDRDFKNFYVLGNDKYKTMSFLNPKRKEIIKAFPNKDFQLEVKNNILSFGLPKVLSLDHALQISKFLKDI